MAQHFDQPQETDSELRTQRMTADESRAVIDLWQQEQTELTGLTDKPAVPDVAEGLDITVEDVQRLLLEVRTRRIEAERVVEEEASPAYTGLDMRRVCWTLLKISAFVVVLYLSVSLFFKWTTFPERPNQDSGCILSLPDGTSQPCGPDYYRAHPEAK